MQDAILIKGAAKVGPRVEIARSFSFKLNLGNYQSADFFCSEKAECAAEDADTTSEAIYAFCRKQVMKAVADYQIEQLRKEKMSERRTA